jgi:hypothetical protein
LSRPALPISSGNNLYSRIFDTKDTKKALYS